ncbi:MAG: GGDEF domain-containing response regulator [Anaerolineales bacterium]|nr:GGDEF domain-containing response regulator [Anaerolineales bacterium]
MIDKVHVLIVEDEKDTASFFDFVLSLVGFECDVVNTAREALSRLSVVEPDIVLLDIRLGGEISGEDILHQIRSNPRFDKTRVIVVTAYPSMAEMVVNLADLILIKPVEVEQLQNLAERLGSLQGSSSRLYYRDTGTGLYNQTFFQIRLEHALERAKLRPDFLFAVFVFTIDLAGVEAGSAHPGVLKAILRQVAERFQTIIRPTDTIAHLGGGKFASLHEELRGPEDVQIIIERLQEKLGAPFEIEAEDYKLNIQLGAAIYDRRFQSAEEILRAAEGAMALAVDNGEKSQKTVNSYGALLE